MSDIGEVEGLGTAGRGTNDALAQPSSTPKSRLNATKKDSDSERKKASRQKLKQEKIQNKREQSQSRAVRWPNSLRLSPLTIQMICIHLIGLILITGGVLYLSQTNENLIDAHQRLLAARARLLAGTIADAIDRSDDVGRLLHRQDLIPLLRRPTSTDGTYARVFNAEGALITDSNLIHDRIEQTELPPPHEPVPSPDLLESVLDRFSDFLLGSRYELKATQNVDVVTTNEEGVKRALQGQEAYLLRRNDQGELVVGFFTPIQPVQHVVGALVLEVTDIDEAILAERENIFQLFLIAALITFGLLMIQSQAVVRPIKRLADAADIIRQGKTARAQIPDFSKHKNEIGDLSKALRDMTNALYDRLESNEHFAADVAHEIKNPLTSLRSAVETFDIAKTDEMRAKLLRVIKDDVGRIDRLVSDISRISRLDAELARKDANPVDLYALFSAISDMYAATRKEQDPTLEVIYESEDLAHEGRYIVSGFEDSLGQVFNNLIDNARSFSPADGAIRILIKRRYRDGASIVIVNVEDEGPGIPEENLENIFERFYTSRPEAAAFGTHSGLGLNICRQIVEAHGGSILAENRYVRDDNYPQSQPGSDQQSNEKNNISSAVMKIAGARFIVSLPTRPPGR